MSARLKQIEAELIKDPFLTSRQIGARIGTTAVVVRSTVQKRAGVTLNELRQEVFDGYWQRVPTEGDA